MTLRIVVYIPGKQHFVSPDVMFGELAKKLRDKELSSGQHDVLIYDDGSVGVDGEIVWRPKPVLVARAG